MPKMPAKIFMKIPEGDLKKLKITDVGISEVVENHQKTNLFQLDLSKHPEIDNLNLVCYRSMITEDFSNRNWEKFDDGDVFLFIGFVCFSHSKWTNRWWIAYIAKNGSLYIAYSSSFMVREFLKPVFREEI